MKSFHTVWITHKNIHTNTQRQTQLEDCVHHKTTSALKLDPIDMQYVRVRHEFLVFLLVSCVFSLLALFWIKLTDFFVVGQEFHLSIEMRKQLYAHVEMVEPNTHSLAFVKSRKRAKKFTLKKKEHTHMCAVKCRNLVEFLLKRMSFRGEHIYIKSSVLCHWQ